MRVSQPSVIPSRFSGGGAGQEEDKRRRVTMLDRFWFGPERSGDAIGLLALVHELALRRGHKVPVVVDLRADEDSAEITGSTMRIIFELFSVKMLTFGCIVIPLLILLTLKTKKPM